MASIYHFYEESVHAEACLVASYKTQNEKQSKVNWAATKIQSFFRGMVTRKKMEKDKQAAIILQRNVRGWLLRYHLPDILQEYYDNLCLKFYNQAAAKIQARWRGYVVRKYEVCIRDILAERAQVAKANEEISKLFRIPFSEFNKTDYEISDDYVHKIYNIMFDRHHLLSTERKKGVLSKEGSEELSTLEKLLKAIPWKNYMKDLHKIYYDSVDKKEPYVYKYHKCLRKQEEYLQYMIERYGQLTPEPPKKVKKTGKEFHLTSRIDYKKPDLITTTGKFRKPIREITRTVDQKKNICCKDFDLIDYYHLDLKPKIPNYKPNFWYEECPCNQRKQM